MNSMNLNLNIGLFPIYDKLIQSNSKDELYNILSNININIEILCLL